MITEDYVSFEIAKLLREKSFDEMCQKVYMHNGQLLWAQIFMEGESFVDNKCIDLVANYNGWITYTQGEYAYLCPTLQMAMKWLREVHDIDISIIPLRSHKEYLPRVESNTISYDAISCKEYEDACETAIKYCLENLI